MYETIVFYRHAPEDLVENFESLLDAGKERDAKKVIQGWFDSYYTKQVTAKKPPTDYTKEPPQVGDMVIIIPTGRYARVMSISDDGALCVVKEQLGAYVVPYNKIIRIR